MLRGLVAEIANWKFTISASNSFSLAGGDFKNWAAGSSTSFATDYLTTHIGYSLSLTATNLPMTNNIAISFACSSVGASYSGSVAYADSATAELIFSNIQLFVDTTATWKLKIGSYQLKINGSVVTSSSAGWTITTGMPLSPQTIPIWGCHPSLSGSCANAVSPTFGCDTSTSSYSSSWSGTTTGGWSVDFGDGLGYITYPVVWAHSNRTSSVTGTNTGAVTLSYSGSVTKSAYTFDKYDYTASCGMICPDLPKSFKRMNLDDYEALIVRGGLQNVYHSYSSSVGGVQDCEFEEITPPTSVSTNTAVLPTQSQFLEQVKNTPNPATIEGILNYNSYSWGAIGDSYIWGRHFSCGSDAYGDSFGYIQDTTSAINPTFKYSGDDEARLNYMNWVNPHWHYFLWFPPDSSGSTVRWNLQGAPSDISYWETARQQYVFHPSLSTSTQSRHRVNVISEPITQNYITGYVDGIMGMPCFWGINSFKVLDKSSYPSSFGITSASSGRFSSDGVLNYGLSSIACNSGASYLEFALESYTISPMMAPSIAKSLQIGYSTNQNLNSLNIYMVGIDGQKILIGDIGVGTGITTSMPVNSSKKWATSAAQDFGQLEFLDDYIPVKSGNISTNIFSDSKYPNSFAMLPGFSAKTLRYEFTKSISTSPIFLKYPTFYMPDYSTSRVYSENGKIDTILFPSSPACRFGNLVFFDYIFDTVLSTPIVDDITLAPTIGDLWCFENAFFKGVDAQTGIATRMFSDFVYNEEYTVDKHLWRDPDSQVGTVGKFVNSSTGAQGIYYNSYREIPPMSFSPGFAKTYTSAWAGIGTRGAFQHSDIKNKQYIISPSNQSPIATIGTQVITQSESSLTGWAVSSYTIATTGNETLSDLKIGFGQTIFKMRPWRGFFFIYGASNAGKLASTYSLDGKIGLSSDDGTQIGWQFFDPNKNLINSKIIQGTDSSLFQFNQKHFIGYNSSGSIKLEDYNNTMSATITTSSPESIQTICFGDGTVSCYWINGGTAYLQKLDTSLTLLGGIVATNITGVSSITSINYEGSNGRINIFLGVITTGGNFIVYTSTDGVIFS